MPLRFSPWQSAEECARQASEAEAREAALLEECAELGASPQTQALVSSVVLRLTTRFPNFSSPELRVGCRLHLVSRLEAERRLAEAACAGARRSAAAFAKKAEGMAAVETAAAAAAAACAAQVARATAALEQQRAARAAAARAAADNLAAATAEAERAIAARDEAQAEAAACVP